MTVTPSLAGALLRILSVLGVRGSDGGSLNGLSPFNLRLLIKNVVAAAAVVTHAEGLKG